MKRPTFKFSASRLLGAALASVLTIGLTATGLAWQEGRKNQIFNSEVCGERVAGGRVAGQGAG
jgi:hypothetical protein